MWTLNHPRPTLCVGRQQPGASSSGAAPTAAVAPCSQRALPAARSPCPGLAFVAPHPRAEPVRCLGPSSSSSSQPSASTSGGSGHSSGTQQHRHGTSSRPQLPQQQGRQTHPELVDGEELLYPEFSAYNPPQGWVKMYTPGSLTNLAGAHQHQQQQHYQLPGSSSSSSSSGASPSSAPSGCSSSEAAAAAAAIFGNGAASATPQGLQWTGEFSEDDIFVPPPSNLPTSHHASSLFVPRKDMWTLTGQPGIDMFLAGPMAWGRLPQVFVILFGVGEMDTEGIYSLRAFGDDGLPQETIIAFETEEDAQQYAGLLEATMDHTPNVCSIPPRELLDFCVEQGYSCRLEPQGSLLIPPDYNVGVTDWERSLRLREGRWAVLDEEPDRSPSAMQHTKHLPLHVAGGGAGVHPHQQAKPGMPHSTLAHFSTLADAGLDAIRAKLEKLLPADE